MQPDRNDMIGAACAGLAICLIAWLSLDSWAISKCHETLRTADFAAAAGDALDPALQALKERLKTGQGSADELACVKRIGLPPG